MKLTPYFSNFDSLKSTETGTQPHHSPNSPDFSNFDSLKSTETAASGRERLAGTEFQQFRLVEEY